MNRKSSRTTVFLCTTLLLSALVACGKHGSQGRLGIVVPVGQERVGRDAPYIITGVYEGSPAYRAGLRPDDRIVQINGKELDGLEYEYIYNNLLLGPAGSRVTIIVERKGEMVVADVVRGE